MAQGTITGAGNFIIEELKLVTTTGMEIDLRTSIMGLTLFEDMFSFCISGTIAIQDSVNLASHGPLIGQEYLHLKIRTPSVAGSEEEESIDFSKNAFTVNSITKRQKLTSGVQGIVLSFVSQELTKNQRTKVVQSLTGPWSDIVEKMMVNYLDTKKKIHIEPSAGIKKFIAPNIRPLDLIGLATKQAIAKYKGESTYIFYENMKGFNFRTLASLYNEPSQLEYVTTSPGTNHPSQGPKYDPVRELRTIIDYEIISANDSIINYSTGMFGSTLYTHDIISKSYSKSVYNYIDNFENESHIVGGATESKVEHPLVSALALNEKGQRVSDFPARTFLMPTSLTGGVDSQHATENNTNPYISNDPEKWLQKRTSQMTQLENAFQLNILVHGNTVINAGDKVTVKIPRLSKVIDPDRPDGLDRFYSGPFLVKKIRHDFDVTTRPWHHQMHMQLVKDSLEEPLDAPTDNIEPSENVSDGVEFYEYGGP